MGSEMCIRDRTDFNINLTEPRLFDSTISAGFDAFNNVNDLLSFTMRTSGGGIRLGKNISEYETVSLGYRLEKVNVSGVLAADETAFLVNGKRTTSRLQPTYVYDSRDNFLNPSQGWRHVVGFEFAGLGGQKFTKSVYEVIYYLSLIHI